MENKKINEEVKEIKGTEKAEVKQEEKHLVVERESFIASNGEQYWAYLVKGKVRGRDIKVDFSPKDKGGYEPLDIVFDVSPTAELIMTDEEMTDNNGKTTKYTSYKVRTIDEFGLEYECGIKPSRDSDKSLLKMLLNNLKLGV